MSAIKIPVGSLADFKGEAIGSGLAGKFGLGVGDELTLVSPQGAATAFISPDMKSGVRCQGVKSLASVISPYDTNENDRQRCAFAAQVIASLAIA